MASISGLSIYPVKSLAGLELPAVQLDRFGFVGDRRWMLVDENHRFLSQREAASMALIGAQPRAAGLELSLDGDNIFVREPTDDAGLVMVRVWEDTVRALDGGDDVASWLSERLGQTCRLVYMPDSARRYVDGVYASDGQTMAFADGFPILLISKASLDDLNSRLQQPVPMNRFRPNLVVEGCGAFAEDNWRRLRIAGIEFEVAKPCARCAIPSIDQATAQKGSEILTVLASYRRGEDRQIYFGQNLLYGGGGELKIGDAVEVLETRD